MNDRQIKLLEGFSPEFRERHTISKYTGDLVAVDTFFIGQLKGIGNIYLQTVIDCFAAILEDALTTPKILITALHILNRDTLSFFEQYDATTSIILSDNGREFSAQAASPL